MAQKTYEFVCWGYDSGLLVLMNLGVLLIGISGVLVGISGVNKRTAQGSVSREFGSRGLELGERY